MKRIFLSVIIILLLNVCASASEIKANIVSAPQIKAGEEAAVRFSLANPDGSAATLDDLKEVHTRKIHALIVDPSLSDYNHVHPVVTENLGEYKFSFTPKTDNSYKVWLDITPVEGLHQYIPLEIKGTKKAAAISKKVIVQAMAGAYEFKISFAPKEIKKGEVTMANLKVSKEGVPFDKLEPVMGAYAHVVGFYDDYKTIAHIHPMGAEPTKEADRGGPELMFHIEPARKGILKLFAQVRIYGKDIFVPFSVVVK